jgi:hypothetical protein
MASARRTTEGQAALRIPTTVERGPRGLVLALMVVRVRGPRDPVPVQAPAPALVLVQVRGLSPVWIARPR